MTLAAGFDRGLGREGHPTLGSTSIARVRISTITLSMAAKEGHFYLRIPCRAGG